MKAPSIQVADVGRIARLRQRHDLIDEVDTSARAGTTVARLSGIDADDLGRSLEVVWEAQREAQLHTAGG
jgi:hypothetical protein